MIKLELKGTRSVLDKLKAYRQKVNQDAKKQVAKTAYAIETRAKQNVRVDTGRLRASIHVEFGQSGLSASVGSNVEYAQSQEFGLPGRRYSYTPYLNPAFEAEKQAFLDSLKQIFK